MLGTVQCQAVPCSPVQCTSRKCDALQCSAVQFSAVQCTAVQCSALQGSGYEYGDKQRKMNNGWFEYNYNGGKTLWDNLMREKEERDKKLNAVQYSAV